MLDEIHQLLESGDFRKHFNGVAKLLQEHVQIVGLTGTLPPHLERPLRELLHLPDDTLIVRGLTSRPELAINICKVDSDQDIVNTACRLAYRMSKELMRRDSWGIIYTFSKDECKAIASVLGCQMFHAYMSPEDKKLSYETWRKGRTGSDRWMVATSAFTHGIDKDYVDGIIIAGLLHGMIETVQAMSRGGRKDCRRCDVVILYGPGKCKVKEEDYALARELNEWVRKVGVCHRKGLGWHMDGIAVECKDLENAEKCNVCDKSSPVRRMANECCTASWDPVSLASGRLSGAELEVRANKMREEARLKRASQRQQQSTPSEWEPTPREGASGLGKSVRSTSSASHVSPFDLDSMPSTPLKAVKEKRRTGTPYEKTGTVSKWYYIGLWVDIRHAHMAYSETSLASGIRI